MKHCFLQANRDVEAWLQVIMSPLEAQIREHKGQLKRRMQSMQRIHLATDSLEEKIIAIENVQLELHGQKNKLTMLDQDLVIAIGADLVEEKVAA